MGIKENTMGITAKPIIKDRFWVLQADGKRVGMITKEDDGVHVNVQGGHIIVDSVKQAEKKYNIKFEKAPETKTVKATNEVYGYPTSSKAHNPVMDIQKKIPQYTKAAKSKSWFAAGYYAVELPEGRKGLFCPKLITLQRHDFSGPFKTKEEMEESLYGGASKLWFTY
jgi:hypothetical protein